MCSTPKPKRKVKTKTSNNSVGILSGMSIEKRQQFAQQANQASDRRLEIHKLQQKQLSLGNITINRIKNNKITKTNTTQSWFYQLLNTSISDLLRFLAR